jgi:uncharacterized protein (TIGR02145 family)
MPNPKKSSKIPFLLAALIFLILALIFVVLFIFYAYSSDDADSNDNVVTYKTVQIGEQVWFAENLNYDAEGSKCYDNNPDNCAKYGRLYNWETAMKVCPEGWHLPSDAEWDKLLRFVDGDKGKKSPYESSTAGKYLKAKSGWNEDGNGTDKYGFSVLQYDFLALPGGNGHLDGRFGNVGDHGFWWSASELNSDEAYYQNLYHGYNATICRSYSKSIMFSVRCVKD